MSFLGRLTCFAYTGLQHYSSPASVHIKKKKCHNAIVNVELAEEISFLHTYSNGSGVVMTR